MTVSLPPRGVRRQYSTLLSAVAYPVIEVISPSSYEGEWLRLHTEHWVELLEGTSGPYVVLVDSSAVTSLPSAQARARIAKMRDRLLEYNTQRCVATATIVPNPVARGAITALNWMRPDANPAHPVPNREGAIKYLSDAWVKAGEPLAELHFSSDSMPTGDATGQSPVGEDHAKGRRRR